jgi:hypothetical protein
MLVGKVPETIGQATSLMAVHVGSHRHLGNRTLGCRGLLCRGSWDANLV